MEHVKNEIVGHTMRAILGLAFADVLFICACRHGVEPPAFKSPRDYAWNVDTIAYPGSYQTSMQSIWGNSASEVYVVGHNDQVLGSMWRFDGTKWSDIKLSAIEGGPIRTTFDLSDVLGFGPNNIFVAGEHVYRNPAPPSNFLDSSLIVHFDGRQWMELTLPRARFQWALWGTSSSDLWTGGFTSSVYHYDGQVWKEEILPAVVPGDANFVMSSIAGNSRGDLFVLGSNNWYTTGKTVNYFFIRRSAYWRIVDSAIVQPGLVENKWGTSRLWVSSSQTLYSVGGGIFRWDGSSWTRMTNSSVALSRISGTDDSNILVSGAFGLLMHFNGIDWYQFNQFSNADAVLGGIWTDGNECFVVGFTASYPQKTFVLHGR